MAGVVATFYKFVSCPDSAELRAKWLPLCQQYGIKGTILIATEGINGTLWGIQPDLEAVLAVIQQDARFTQLDVKQSASATSPFERLKIKLKREIVTLGVPTVDPTQAVGQYVDPADWNALIQDPDVILVDTRNDYEVEVGTFPGAVNPETRSFREFPDYVATHLDPAQHPKVAMFCTGGIRCEKASAYLLSQGFQEVYHLKGGILKYLEEIPTEASLWQGECFVFDDRVALQHELAVGHHQLCRSCGYPITELDRTHPAYEEWISCPNCIATLTPEKRLRQQEKRRQWSQALRTQS